MKILKTKGIIKEGQIFIEAPSHPLLTNTDIEVILSAK
jgi:hypothetical protein